MNKLFTKIGTAMVGIAMAIGVGVAASRDNKNDIPVFAAPTGAITSHTNIAAGDYYIGATNSTTDYYLQVDGSALSTSKAGTAVTSKASGTIFTFANTGTNTWSIKFKDYANYLGLKSSKDNGKVQIVSSAVSFTASTVGTGSNAKIRLSIGDYSIEKNSGGTQFGSYGNTGTDLWLLPASSKKATTTTVSAAGSKTTLDSTKDPKDTVQLSATVSYASGDLESPSITWTSGTTSVATVSASGLVTAVSKGKTRITASYAGDSTYEESTGYIDIIVADPNAFVFTNLDWTSWSTTYEEHVVEYERGTVTFASADKNGSTITDIPVTKGEAVSFVVADGYYIAGAEFVCRQWGTKAQTITLHYSTDGGENYTNTGVTSTNFTISKNDFVAKTNAVKITFDSDNQVGIESLTITYTKTWAREFLDTFTCSGATQEHPNGAITAENPATVWSALATSLDSDSSLKTSLKTLAADEGGTVNQQAMARYDLVIRKYGTGTYNDFIGRFLTGGINASVNLETRTGSYNSSSVIIIVVSALVATVTIGGIFLIRRRKEEK